MTKDSLFMPHGQVHGWSYLLDRMVNGQGQAVQRSCIPHRLVMKKGQVDHAALTGRKFIKDKKHLCQRQVCLVSLTSW